MRPASRFLLVLAPLALLAGCNAVDARVWNLNELHGPAGRPKYNGRIRSATNYQFYRFLESTRFRSESFDPAEPEPIEDPLAKCLDNVVGLAECDRDDERTRSLMIEYLAWLAVDCTYSLSRERCGREIGDLGARILVRGPIELEEGVETADASAVGDALTGLIESARPFLEGGGDETDTDTLRARCEAALALELDHRGTKRLLAAATIILGRTGFDEVRVAPLAEFLRKLQRRALGLALAALLADENARVRATGVMACCETTGNRSPDVLAAAFEDPAPEVRLAGVEVIHRLGIPAAPLEATDAERADHEELWMSRLISILATRLEGRASVLTCQTLATLSGEPLTLRPEDWLNWWEERVGVSAIVRPQETSAPDAPR